MRIKSCILTFRKLADLIGIVSIEQDIYARTSAPPEHASIHPALSSGSNRSASHIRARVVASVVRWRATLLSTALMAGGKRILSCAGLS